MTNDILQKSTLILQGEAEVLNVDKEEEVLITESLVKYDNECQRTERFTWKYVMPT